MNIEILYLLKVSLCTAAFYALYHCLFRRNTFFKLNRIYLIAGLSLSFAIPKLSLPVSSFEYHIPAVQFFDAAPADIGHETEIATTDIEKTAIDFSILTNAAYWMGFVYMSIRFFISVVSIIRIRKNAESLIIHNTPVFLCTTEQPFSFFRWIFLPRNEENFYIVNHYCPTKILKGQLV